MAEALELGRGSVSSENVVRLSRGRGEIRERK